MATIKVKAIIPDNVSFDMKRFNSDVLRVLDNVTDKAKSEFEKTTATWKKKPVFRGARASLNKEISKMWGNTQEWIWVNRGTKPHTITPKRAPALRFQSGFTSKTMPRKITSRRGGSSGPVVFAKSVRHPGTEARDFDKVVAQELRPVLVKEVRNAIKRATS